MSDAREERYQVKRCLGRWAVVIVSNDALDGTVIDVFDTPEPAAEYASELNRPKNWYCVLGDTP